MQLLRTYDLKLETCINFLKTHIRGYRGYSLWTVLIKLSICYLSLMVFKEHCHNMFSSMANYFTISLIFFKHGTQITVRNAMYCRILGIKEETERISVVFFTYIIRTSLISASAMIHVWIICFLLYKRSIIVTEHMDISNNMFWWTHIQKYWSEMLISYDKEVLKHNSILSRSYLQPVV